MAATATADETPAPRGALVAPLHHSLLRNELFAGQLNATMAAFASPIGPSRPLSCSCPS